MDWFDGIYIDIQRLTLKVIQFFDPNIQKLSMTALKLPYNRGCQSLKEKKERGKEELNY